MLCLEVWINNERLCTAGVEESGRLTALLNWDYYSDDTDERLEKECGGKSNNPGLKVYGSSGGEPPLHFSWLERGIEQGDLITFKLTDLDFFDPPEVSDLSRYELSDASTPEEINEMWARDYGSTFQDNPKYGLEVRLNGKHLCTAELEDFGNLGVRFHWHNVPQHPRSATINPSLVVNGHLEKEPFESLQWLQQPLAIGDEITFELLGASDFDQPEVVELVTLEAEDC